MPAPPTSIVIVTPDATVKSPAMLAPRPPACPAVAAPPCAPVATTCTDDTHGGTENVCIAPVKSNVCIPCAAVVVWTQPVAGAQVSVVHASPSSHAIAVWTQPIAPQLSVVHMSWSSQPVAAHVELAASSSVAIAGTGAVGRRSGGRARGEQGTRNQ